ncbi:RNA polymerase sigma factor [Aquisphaera insulae]|uniref:RNA polymerase sigma factor n=1 Tax=Aquisphaera insulae TaxID=2712864 RepID=UPI00202EB4F8|nr:sigma-70 family RNA polymerase sigma factor [Aquisphaera insulae]
MENPTPMRTSASLLGRLRLEAPGPGDWDDFMRRYGPMIRQWCRRWKLQDADAEDVTQDVLARLASRLRTFEYDPSRSFRAYVKTVAHFAWCDLIESRKRPGAGGTGDSAVLDQLHGLEARDDLQARLVDAFDHEVLEEATARIRLRVEARTWDAFRLTAVEGLSGAEAAERVGMSIAAVFKAKSKVQKMLREEVQRLEGGP